MTDQQITTTRFGRIEIAEESLLQFPRGLYGLEERRSFCLLRHDEAGCFHWLQSTDEPGLAMLVTDPFQFFRTYEVEIADPIAALLQVDAAANVTTYVTVTLARTTRQLQANLLGPLVINHRSRLGAQVILDGTRYTTRHMIVDGAHAPSESDLPDGWANPGRSDRTAAPV
jgi:flagellar assembly factor FliW